MCIFSERLRKDPEGPPKHFLKFPISTGGGGKLPCFLFFTNRGICSSCRLCLAICSLPWEVCEAVQEPD